MQSNVNAYEPLLDADGKEIRADQTFIPDEPDGTVEVTFRFDAIKAGLVTESGAFPNLVCFETLLFHTEEEEDVPVADHEDLEDEGQTVELRQRGRETILLFI